jgi:hypothetical protein
MSDLSPKCGIVPLAALRLTLGGTTRILRSLGPDEDHFRELQQDF